MVALQLLMAESGRKLIDEIHEKTSKQMEEARASISSQATAASDELKGNAEEFASQIANRLAGRQIA
jgi:F0F1-type ATP synthase membrane subunit b/b'